MPLGRRLMVHLVYSIWSGVGLRDLALLYRQFSAMIHAGVPIYQCLDTLVRQTSNGKLRGMLQRIGAHVQEGGMLTEAMAEFPWVFTDFHRAMIAAGEQSGQLDIMMARLATALEQEQTLRGVIKKETWYPATILVMSFLLPPVVDIVVLKNAALYYHEAVRPLLIFGGFLAAGYVVTRFLAQFKAAYDWLLATLPGIGGAVRMVALARFARALASLYAAGVSIPESLRFAAAATGNAYMEERIIRAIPAIRDGRGITEALMASGVFPPMVISMLGTGEQTGSLDQMMDNVAGYYEQEAVVRLHQLGVTLGVIAMIIAGIRVCMTLIKFYTDYYNNLNNMANPDAP